MTTKANPSTIGPTRSALSRVATTPKSSSSASPTIASEDKDDPIYYARHTVAKAKEQLDKNDHHVQHEIAEKIDLKH